MALTRTAGTLTEAHRQAQATIRTRFTGRFVDAWPLLDPYRLDATAAAWLAVAEPLVGQYRRQSAAATAAFYPAHRAAELPAIGLDAPELAPVLAEQADPQALRTSLLVTGPVTIKRLSGKRVPVDQAARVAGVRAEAAAVRHVLGGGRATMRATINADPVALGWVRVTDGDPCWLCAMLASRGPVYKSKKDRSHCSFHCWVRKVRPAMPAVPISPGASALVNTALAVKTTPSSIAVRDRIRHCPAASAPGSEHPSDHGATRSAGLGHMRTWTGYLIIRYRGGMRTMTATEASRNFSDLLDAIERGETVTITRGNHPVAEISPARRRTGADLRAALADIPTPDDRFAADIANAVALLDADGGDPWADA